MAEFNKTGWVDNALAWADDHLPDVSNVRAKIRKVPVAGVVADAALSYWDSWYNLGNAVRDRYVEDHTDEDKEELNSNLKSAAIDTGITTALWASGAGLTSKAAPAAVKGLSRAAIATGGVVGAAQGTGEMLSGVYEDDGTKIANGATRFVLGVIMSRAAMKTSAPVAKDGMSELDAFNNRIAKSKAVDVARKRVGESRTTENIAALRDAEAELARAEEALDTAHSTVPKKGMKAFDFRSKKAKIAEAEKVYDDPKNYNQPGLAERIDELKSDANFIDAVKKGVQPIPSRRTFLNRDIPGPQKPTYYDRNMSVAEAAKDFAERTVPYEYIGPKVPPQKGVLRSVAGTAVNDVFAGVYNVFQSLSRTKLVQTPARLVTRVAAKVPGAQGPTASSTIANAISTIGMTGQALTGLAAGAGSAAYAFLDNEEDLQKRSFASWAAKLNPAVNETYRNTVIDNALDSVSSPGAISTPTVSNDATVGERVGQDNAETGKPDPYWYLNNPKVIHEATVRSLK